MEECVKLDDKTIVSTNWNKVTLPLHIIAKVSKQRKAGENSSDLVTRVASVDPVSRANQSGGGGFSSSARIWGECLTFQFPPALFFFFLLSGD